MSRWIGCFVIVSCGILTACGARPAGQSTAALPTTASAVSSPPPPAPPPPPMAHVRILHASPEPAAASVTVQSDDASTPLASSLVYRSAAGYFDAAPGEHTVNVGSSSGASSGAPALITVHSPALEAGHYYTAVAFGMPTGRHPYALVFAADDSSRPADGHARVRFLHATANEPAVDLCIAGATARAPGAPVFANVAFGSWGSAAAGQGSYAEVPSGAALSLQVRAHGEQPCVGRVRGTFNISPAERAVLTLVSVGHAGRPPVAREIMVCDDAPSVTSTSACQVVPVAEH